MEELRAQYGIGNHQNSKQQEVPESAEREQNVFRDSTLAKQSVTSPGSIHIVATLVPTILFLLLIFSSQSYTS